MGERHPAGLRKLGFSQPPEVSFFDQLHDGLAEMIPDIDRLRRSLLNEHGFLPAALRLETATFPPVRWHQYEVPSCLFRSKSEIECDLPCDILKVRMALVCGQQMSTRTRNSHVQLAGLNQQSHDNPPLQEVYFTGITLFVFSPYVNDVSVDFIS